MKNKLSIIGVLVALCTASITLADCYTTNCTGADISGRRGCYLCCASDCVGDGELDCQESCDSAWVMRAIDFVPLDALSYIISTKGDAKAQMGFLTDVDMWDWLTDTDEINIRVIEIADWFFQNAADIRVERMALVTLSWLKTDHKLTHDGSHLVKLVMIDALHSDDARVRRSALVSLREIGAHKTNQAIKIDMVRATLQDPDQSVRQMGMKILADY